MEQLRRRCFPHHKTHPIRKSYNVSRKHAGDEGSASVRDEPESTDTQAAQFMGPMWPLYSNLCLRYGAQWKVSSGVGGGRVHAGSLGAGGRLVSLSYKKLSYTLKKKKKHRVGGSAKKIVFSFVFSKNIECLEA